MHILLIHQAFAALDEPGGTRHHELARFLAAKGYRVTVIASPVSYLTGRSRQGRTAWVERQQDGKQITLLRAYTYPALHRSFAHRVVSFFSFMFSSFLVGLSVRQVDLVWGTSPPIFQGITAWILARLKRVPFLFEVRDLWPAFAIAVGVLRQPYLIKASEWLERFLYSHADKVMVNSPGFVTHVRERGARHVELIPNGANPDMFSAEEAGAQFRQLHGWGSKFAVLYAGAHGLSNDLGVLLETARLLSDQPEILLVMLGDGKDKPALVQQASKAGLVNVQFLQPVPKVEMPQALAAADACIAILKPLEMYKTVYPNKVFDYMAASRPVILAIDGVIRQVIESADAGIAIQPGDPVAMAEAIRLLFQNRELAGKLGSNGRRYVEQHFDRAALADQLATLLSAMVAQPEQKTTL